MKKLLLSTLFCGALFAATALQAGFTYSFNADETEGDAFQGISIQGTLELETLLGGNAQITFSVTGWSSTGPITASLEAIGFNSVESSTLSLVSFSGPQHWFYADETSKGNGSFETFKKNSERVGSTKPNNKDNIFYGDTASWVFEFGPGSGFTPDFFETDGTDEVYLRLKSIGAGGESDKLVGNLVVVPEPATVISVIALAGLGLMVWRASRRK